MKIIKKQFSLLLAMLMIISLVPISASADAKISVVGGAASFTTSDTNKEVKIRITLDKFTDLKEGRVIFELDNAMLAKTPNPVSATLYQGSTTLTSPDIAFVGASDKAPAGGEKIFNLDVNKEVKANNQNDIEIVVTLKLDFSKSNTGNVNLSLKDIGKDGVKTGIGDYKSEVATDQAQNAKDPDVRVKNKDAKIGPAGGDLSSVTIYDFDKLSNKKEDNKIVITLPEGMLFDKTTKVEADKGDLTVAYTVDKREMTITGVDSNTGYIMMEPKVALQAKSNLKDGKIEPTFRFFNKDKTVFSKEIQLGQLVQFGLTLKAVEKGGRDIPILSKGNAKTVELTVNAVEGTLSNGSVIDFDIDGGQIVFNTLKVTEPAGILLTSSKSAGKSASDKVSGYEVYSDNDFSLRTNKSDIQMIKISFDIVADPLAKDKVTLTAKAMKSEDQKIDIAKVSQTVSLSVTPMSVEKGKIVDLPAVTIKESEKGQIQPNDKIYLELVYTGSDREKGEHIAFQTAKDIKVETTGKLEVQSVELGKQPNILVVTVKTRSYDAPGTIVLSNIKGYLSEKAVTGDVKIKSTINSAVTDETVFFTVGAKPSAGKTTFVIGKKEYMANGVPKTLVTAPYINSGRTMLPVRAVGESLGLSAAWNNETKTATFQDATKVAVVKIGESTITVNGIKMPLNAPAEIKDGSTMIELRSLANAFSVAIDWEATTKTVIING